MSNLGDSKVLLDSNSLEKAACSMNLSEIHSNIQNYSLVSSTSTLSDEKDEPNTVFGYDKNNPLDDERDGTVSCKLKEETNFDMELQNFPHIICFINDLKIIIHRQRTKIKKLYKKLHSQSISSKSVNVTNEVGTQTNDKVDDSAVGWSDSKDLADEVKQVAEDALTQAGMVFEPTSGMYYDYKSGFYYNADLRMYYDGNSGRYLLYNEETKEYAYQDEVPEKSAEAVSKGLKRKLERVEEEAEEKEAGELSDSSCDSEDADLAPDLNPVLPDQEISAGWPPSLRLMVINSSVPSVSVGQLFLVTFNGGRVGRDKNAGLAVLLPETAVSKVHLHINFRDDSYYIVDVGSRNGTWLNEKRVSAALQESEPTKIEHGDSLRVGSTTLAVHVHEGLDTCDGCEPGLQLRPASALPAPLPASVSVRSLKKHFGVAKPAKAPDANYNDRAEVRRSKVGSSHPAEKTETTCLTQAIPTENKGFKMLSKMGWSEGKSLGKNNQGITEPVPLVSNEGSTGLGAVPVCVPGASKGSLLAKKKLRMMKMTHARFNRPPQLPPNDDNDDSAAAAGQDVSKS